MEPPVSEQTSDRMRRIRGLNTKPELTVRRIVWGMGWRYRLHVRSLPGKPDMVFRGMKKAIFVHGCFWHAHEGCKRATMPRTRMDFWAEKFAYNKRRDRNNIQALEEAGWKVLVLWECDLRDAKAVEQRVAAFLGERQS